MSLWVPKSGFAWRTSNVAGTRPATGYGTSVTPGNNTMGSWVQVLSAATVARDVYGILININSGSTTTAARDTLIDIGVDPAGGTSYTTLIPSLLGSCSVAYSSSLGGGTRYYFPIWIKSGSSVAARASVNNATVGTVRVICKIFGSPFGPEPGVGTSVIAYGATAASSSGTAVTPGEASEGAWTSLGTSSAKHWWWQVGMGINNATMAGLAYHLDLGIGDATNKFVVIEDQPVVSNSSEQICGPLRAIGCDFSAPSGTNIYGRMQCSGTTDTGISMIAYGVGG